MLRARRPVPRSCRDRTLEFRGALDAARTGGLHGGCVVAGSPPPPSSEFRARAAAVGAGIKGASTKIAALAQLAKSTAVFDDPTEEIRNLSALVKEDITALNAAVSDLQIIFNSQKEGGNISRDAADHSTAVVDSLKEGLLNTANEFKGVLTTRTQSLRVHQNRRKNFSSSASGCGSNPSVSHNQPSGYSIPPAPWATDSASNPSFQRQRNSSNDVYWRFMQQQLSVQQDSYMQSRAEAIRNMESTVHDLSQIFTQLATMASHQGEIAIRIDENVEDSLANVEGAQGQLLKHLSNISSNRWLTTKIFVALVFFLLIFVIFIA